MGWGKVGGTTPATCATIARAPGGGSGAHSSAPTFPCSVHSGPGKATTALEPWGRGPRPEEKSGKLRVGDGPRAATESHRALFILAPKRPFLFSGLAEKGGEGSVTGKGTRSPRSWASGPEPVPCGPLGSGGGLGLEPGVTSCHLWAHLGQWTLWSRRVHLQCYPQGKLRGS